MHKDHSDELLMQRICKGDRQAFETLYDRYFDKLVWFARKFIDDVQKAEDVVQEVFIKIIEKPAMFDSSKRFSTWVYTVTGNACKRVLRDEENHSRILSEKVLPGQPDATEMQHKAEYRLLKQRINTAFEKLNDKEKNIFTLRFEQELSIKEIAEIANIPEGSVKSGIYYMLKKFAIQLKDFTHGK